MGKVLFEHNPTSRFFTINLLSISLKVIIMCWTCILWQVVIIAFICHFVKYNSLLVVTGLLFYRWSNWDTGRELNFPRLGNDSPSLALKYALLPHHHLIEQQCIPWWGMFSGRRENVLRKQKSLQIILCICPFSMLFTLFFSIFYLISSPKLLAFTFLKLFNSYCKNLPS